MACRSSTIQPSNSRRVRGITQIETTAVIRKHELDDSYCDGANFTRSHRLIAMDSRDPTRRSRSATRNASPAPSARAGRALFKILSHIIGAQKRKIMPTLEVVAVHAGTAGRILLSDRASEFRSARAGRDELAHDPGIEGSRRPSPDAAVTEQSTALPVAGSSRASCQRAAAKNRLCRHRNRQSGSIHRDRAALTRRSTPQPTGSSSKVTLVKAD